MKARGWILEKDNSAIFYCHNCGASMSMGNLLRAVQPGLYDEYIVDRKLDKDMFKREEKKEDSPLDKLLKKQPKFTKDNSPLLKIKKVSSLNSAHPVKKYVDERKIPTAKHYKLYYAPKFNTWVNTLIPDKLPKERDEPRLVLPFIDESGNLFGFTGRAFDKKSLRYITIMLDETKPKIFGLDSVDFSKTYYVVEGPIDSLFLSNAIAMAGADGNMKGLQNIDNSVMVFDNEPRNKDVVARMEKALVSGSKVCIWPSHLTSKDINDMILTGLNATQVQMIIDENTYSGLEGRLALTVWKRV
jgi:hypothetical protein